MHHERSIVDAAQGMTEQQPSLEMQRQAQKMQAIGLLASGIAHDLNNLLTAIGGFTELVLRTLDEGDARREDLQEVAKATRRAGGLTRQLLAVGRRQVVQSTVLDVNEVVADVQTLLRRTIPENIDLRLDLAAALDGVRADRAQLEQVVINLAVNAAEAMAQGGRLRLATATVDVDEPWVEHHEPMPAGRYVRLTVSDTGVGMLRETQARIFEPFFTTKTGEHAIGLGLATVYGTITQCEGFMRVDSEVGLGTSVDVYLPVARESVARSSDVQDLVPDIDGHAKTIVLAEDDDAVRRLVCDVLARRGFSVLDARNGDEALAIAMRHPGPIHLLIADVVMPGLSGRDLAARLTAQRPDVRVLYTSGHTEDVMARAGFEQGLAWLAKPFLPADLLQKVNEALRLGASPQA